jgi:hypothetical protein
MIVLIMQLIELFRIFCVVLNNGEEMHAAEPFLLLSFQLHCMDWTHSNQTIPVRTALAVSQENR